VTDAVATGTRRRLGRFVLGRLLGRGAQASVWLAHDPRLDRDVALKLLDPEAGTDALQEWLHEARAVSRVQHPNVVQVFEADEADGQPYLVFEFVDGGTLADARRGRGAWAAREAVQTALPVLDALAAAHAQGIVHRDLKPSNILVGRDGRVRVMDFGIAARVASPGPRALEGRIVGTAGYMSPEAARGEAPAPAMDVFAVGVMLAELLAGAPLMAERDPYRYLRRVQQEDLRLPDAIEVDDVLRGIVHRALSRDAARRYDGASAMRDALAAWLQPPDAAVHDAAQGRATVDFLLRRMRHKSDFPALSETVVRIQRVAASDTESLGSLSAEILKDVALTQKLLRMVNTVGFRHAAGGGIHTVSRAVALVGFAGIRNLALSLVLLEHMQDKAHAALLRDEFLRALMAGMLAAELLPAPREGEEAFLGAMFQNLGRLLTEFYFPEEAQQIRQQTAVAGGVDAASAREAAAQRVLGLGLQDLGAGIARAWGLPEGLQRAMRAPDGEPPTREAERGAERLRWLGRAANDLADAMLAHDEAAAAPVAVQAARHARALGMAPREIVDAAEAARRKLAELAPALGLAGGATARRLLGVAPVRAEGGAAAAATAEATCGTAEAPTAELDADAPSAAESAAMLAAGIQDITNTMAADEFRLNEVLRMVLETMYRGLGFRRVVFCLRDAKSGVIAGRFGYGADAETVATRFRIAAGASDLFGAVCAKGVDTLIADSRAANIAARLPDWYRRAVNAPSFLLLPLCTRGTPFALIYADSARAGHPALGERELSLLRTLRNQAVMAFRQAGG
jgi:HD-like signal output (HDOD) protein